MKRSTWHATKVGHYSMGSRNSFKKFGAGDQLISLDLTLLVSQYNTYSHFLFSLSTSRSEGWK